MARPRSTPAGSRRAQAGGPPRPPRLPPTLDPVDVDDLGDDDQRRAVAVHGAATGLEAEDVELREAHLHGVDLSSARLTRLELVDVVVEQCDLSGAILDDARFERIAFRSCRLLGLALPLARLIDVTFEDCRLDDANLRMLVTERVRFAGCSMRGADLYEAGLAGGALWDCDLGEAQLSRAVLAGTRLQGSVLDTVHGAEALAGAVLDSTQLVPAALRLFGALGITLDDEREPTPET